MRNYRTLSVVFSWILFLLLVLAALTKSINWIAFLFAALPIVLIIFAILILRSDEESEKTLEEEEHYELHPLIREVKAKGGFAVPVRLSSVGDSPSSSSCFSFCAASCLIGAFVRLYSCETDQSLGTQSSKKDKENLRRFYCFAPEFRQATRRVSHGRRSYQSASDAD